MCLPGQIFLWALFPLLFRSQELSSTEKAQLVFGHHIFVINVMKQHTMLEKVQKEGVLRNCSISSVFKFVLGEKGTEEANMFLLFFK